MNCDIQYDMRPSSCVWLDRIGVCNCQHHNYMREAGVEPASPKAPDPKSGKSPMGAKE